jgi:hypothetical protein
MDTQKLVDRMPALVKTTLGEAQKRLTLMEGNARQLVLGTWLKLRETPSLKKVEQTVAGLQADTAKRVDLARLRKQAERVGVDAFHTVGLATQADLKKVLRQLDSLRADVRKLARKNEHHRPRHAKNNRPKA